MAEVIYSSNTAGSGVTLAATDTNLLTGNIKATQYNFVRVETGVRISTTGTSALNHISIKIKLGSTTLKTVQYKPLAELRTIEIPITYMGDASGNSMSVGGTLAITQSASGADAQTTLTATHLYVTGIS